MVPQSGFQAVERNDVDSVRPPVCRTSRRQYHHEFRSAGVSDIIFQARQVRSTFFNQPVSPKFYLNQCPSPVIQMDDSVTFQSAAIPVVHYAAIQGRGIDFKVSHSHIFEEHPERIEVFIRLSGVMPREQHAIDVSTKCRVDVVLTTVLLLRFGFHASMSSMMNRSFRASI